MARIVFIENPFDPLMSRKFYDVEDGLTIEDAIYRVIERDTTGLDLTVAVNGNVEENYKRQLTVFDSVSFCLTPHGGGGGGKNILRTVAMIAVMVAAPQLASMWGGGWAAGAGGALTGLGSAFASGIAFAGMALVNALFPASTPSLATGVTDWSSDSSTYSWGSPSNRVQEGGALPVVYGTMRVVPPVIMRYLTLDGDKQYLNILYAVAGHEVDSISDIYINDQPLAYYQDVSTYTRLGTNDQTSISGFGDSIVDKGVGATLSYGVPVVRETDGNLLTGLGVGILFPNGLCYANDSGGLSAESVTLSIGYRVAGSSDDYTMLVGNMVQSNAYGLSNAPSGERYVDWISSNILYTTSASITLTCPRTFVNANGVSVLNSATYKVYIQSEGDASWNYISTNTVSVSSAYYESFGVVYSDGSQSVSFSAEQGKKLKVRIVLDSYDLASGVTLAPNTGSIRGVPDISNMSYYIVSGGVTITGSQNSALRKVFSFSGLNPNQYELKVEMTSNPSTGVRHINKCQWEYWTEKSEGYNFRYPKTALLAIKALATEQLSGSDPAVTCLVKRSTLSNGKPATSPAWVCADILTDKLNGAGLDSTKILTDKFDDWHDFCISKDLTCNAYFDTTSNLRTIINQVSVLGRGSVVQYGSKFSCIVDKPDTSVQRFFFGVGNTLASSTQTEYLSRLNRANCVEIEYLDSELDYEQQTLELMQSDFDTSNQEIIKTTVKFIGCTNRNMASKYAKFLLNCNRYLTRTDTWLADIDAIACTIGDVVEKSCDIFEEGYSGRVVSVIDSTHIELDRAVTMVTGKRYGFFVKLSDDSVQKVEVSNTNNTTSVLTLLTALNPLPQKYDNYSFGELNIETKAFRVIAITRANDLQRKITGIEYVEDVYNDSVSIPVINYSDLVTVKNLVVNEVWSMSSDGSAKSSIACSWLGEALFWDIYYKLNSSTAWILAGRSYKHEFIINADFSVGETYNVAVVNGDSINGSPQKSITILGSNVIPSDVENFQAFQSGETVAFRWTHTNDIERRGYEIRRGTSWDSGQIVVDLVQNNTASWNPPTDGTYRFMIKALNNQLQYSETESVATCSVDITTLLNFAVSRDEIPDHLADGTMFNMVLVDDKLYWICGMTDTDFPDDYTDLDMGDYAPNNDMGYYETELFDLGSVVDILGIRMDATYVADVDEALISDLDFDDDLTDFEFLSNDTDTNITSESTYRPYYCFGETPETLGDWQLWTGVSNFSARYIKFKWQTYIDMSATSFYFSSLKLSIEVKNKSKALYNQSISSSGTTFALSSLPFSYVLDYNVGVTVLGNSGYYPNVVKNSDNFVVYVYNSSGVAVSATVDITVEGS